MKAPLRVDQLERGLTRLGLALEMELVTDDEIHRVDLDRTPFFWCPAARALVVLRGTSVVEATPVVDRRTAASRTRERWTHREAQTTERVKLPAVSGPWRLLGPVGRFDYWSDKWRRPGRSEYTHKTESRVIAYAAGPVKTPGVVVLRGGRLAIEWGGITG